MWEVYWSTSIANMVNNNIFVALGHVKKGYMSLGISQKYILCILCNLVVLLKLCSFKGKGNKHGHVLAPKWLFSCILYEILFLCNTIHL